MAASVDTTTATTGMTPRAGQAGSVTGSATTGLASSGGGGLKATAAILCSNQTGFDQYVSNYVNDKLLAYMYSTVKREDWEGYGTSSPDPDISIMPAVQAVAIAEESGGVIESLEAESLSSRGTDARFVSKVLHHSPEYRKPKSTSTFTVKHGFGEICYESTGFVSDNRRLARLELREVMKKHIGSRSNMNALDYDALEPNCYRDYIFEDGIGSDGKRAGRLAYIKKELDELISRMRVSSLMSGYNHMVLCIRGGKERGDAGDDFVGKYVLDQLQATGLPMYAAIRGNLCTRMDATSFLRLYEPVLRRSYQIHGKEQQSRDATNAVILEEYSTQPHQYFIHGEVIFYDRHLAASLERSREGLVMKCSTEGFEALLQGHMARKLFAEIQSKGVPGAFQEAAKPEQPWHRGGVGIFTADDDDELREEEKDSILIRSQKREELIKIYDKIAAESDDTPAGRGRLREEVMSVFGKVDVDGAGLCPRLDLRVGVEDIFGLEHPVVQSLALMVKGAGGMIMEEEDYEEVNPIHAESLAPSINH